MSKKYVDVKIMKVEITIEYKCPYCRKYSTFMVDQINEIEVTCPHCDKSFTAEFGGWYERNLYS